MSTNPYLIGTQSSCSEDEISTKFHPISSSIDADADESDNGNSKDIKKSRRLQKTRRISNSSIQKPETNSNSKDELQRLSSNEDGNNERRLKSTLLKKSDHLTTTSDDDVIKQYHRYHPLDNIDSKLTATTTTNESNLSSPIPEMTPSTNQPSVKKVNRFQVKSIRKSQQQILLANANTAKSSNDDDCSVPNNKSNLQLKPSIIDRKHTNTPTTDGEHTATNTENLVNNAVSALNSVEHEHHHVRFQVIPHGKHESTAEEEKTPNQISTAVSLPTPTAPPSSTASAQGEVRIRFFYLKFAWFYLFRTMKKKKLLLKVPIIVLSNMQKKLVVVLLKPFTVV
jgi:hypothetical protein